MNKKTKKIIKNTIYEYLPKDKFEAFIFGSWTNGRSRKYSDIDIGIEGKSAIDFETLAKIKDKFEESDLPYSIDIVDFSYVSDEFKKISKQNIIPI